MNLEDSIKIKEGINESNKGMTSGANKGVNEFKGRF